MCQDRAPKHSPKLEGPPGRPPTLRHGQIASQLHASKYDPRTRHSLEAAISMPPRHRYATRSRPGAMPGAKTTCTAQTSVYQDEGRGLHAASLRTGREPEAPHRVPVVGQPVAECK